MTTGARISTPLPLVMQRLRHQTLPILTVIACASLATWLWARQNRAAFATGEVSSVRIEIESKYDGILQELPQPVRLFDAVRSGQVVARIDTAAVETELRRLEQEFGALQTGAATPATTQPAAGWYQARIDELRARIDSRDLKSSIAGMVVKIDRHPGEAAKVGKPIITVASARGEFIVGYLRQDQPLHPAVGMDVELRSRGSPGRTFLSQVISVGAQVEPIPPRHWRNPQTPEWGLPLQIALPPDAALRPGELLDLILRPANP